MKRSESCGQVVAGISLREQGAAGRGKAKSKAEGLLQMTREWENAADCQEPSSFLDKDSGATRLGPTGPRVSERKIVL